MAQSGDKWFSMRADFFNAESYLLGLHNLSSDALAAYVVAVAYASKWGLDYCFALHAIQEATGRRSRVVLRELVESGFWVRSLESEGIYHIAHEGTLWRRGTPVQRRAIPVAIRAAVMTRDNYECFECGSADELTLDHIWPYSKGGQDTVENLRILCRSCNSRKGARVDGA